MNNDEIIKKLEEEYDSLISKLEIEKHIKISKLKDNYKEKLDIKIGDIIYNVTGIIKIESLDFKIRYNGRGDRLPVHIIFKGTKYKWIKGGLISKIKNNQKGELYSYGNLKKIDKSKVL